MSPFVSVALLAAIATAAETTPATPAEPAAAAAPVASPELTSDAPQSRCPQPDAQEQALLRALRQRRQALDVREAELQKRSAALDVLAKTLNERLQKTEADVAELEARLDLGEPGRKTREKKMTALVDTLSSLSARKAAPMLADTDPGLVGDLLLRLGPARSGGLLALMPPPQAALVLERVSGIKKSTPPAGTASGKAAAPNTGKKP